MATGKGCVGTWRARFLFFGHRKCAPGRAPASGRRRGSQLQAQPSPEGGLLPGGCRHGQRHFEGALLPPFRNRPSTSSSSGGTAEYPDLMAFTLSRASGDRVRRRVRSFSPCGPSPDCPTPSRPTKPFDEAYATMSATKRDDEVCVRSAGYTLSLHFVPTLRRLRFVPTLRRFSLPVRTSRIRRGLPRTFHASCSRFRFSAKSQVDSSAYSAG